MEIKKISDRNQNLLHASLHVNNFKRVVEELVYNSLDADSTSIAIRVCIKSKYIKVLDNGIGITEDNFRLLGDKYVTSKFIDDIHLKSTSNKYGYKGISLASIIEVSENVKISSKFENSNETWMKKFSKGSVEEFHLTTSRPSKGTTVEILGFLYNLNIQQKSIDLLNEINLIKLALEQLSLVHSNVSLSLRDDSKNEIIFKIHKNRNIYQTLWSLFEINMNDLKDLQVEKNQYKVKAYIGKNCLVPKKYRWVFLNGRFISRTFVHKKINENLIKKSLIKTTNKTKVQFTGEYNFNCKIPFYFIFISCPNFDFDIIYNYKQTFIEFKNCEEVNKLIEKLINLYYGDVTLKPIIVREEVNHENNDDTRRKVKEIVEKILNKHEVKTNTMQLQKEIKGKNIKRKVKKINIIKTQKNIIEKKSNYKNLSKPKQSSNAQIEMDKQLNCNEFSTPIKPITNLLINNKHKIKNLHINDNKNISKGKKTAKTSLKSHASIKPLIKKFEVPTETVQKRCRKLTYEVQTLLNREYFNSKRIFKAYKQRGLDFHTIRQKDEVNKREQKSIQKHTKSKFVEHSSSKHLTIYDLLKTNEVKRPPMNVLTDTQNTVINDNIESYEMLLSTFNSHKENMKIIRKELNRKSHKNLHTPNQNLHPNTKNNQPKRKASNLNLIESTIVTEYSNTNDSLNLHHKTTNAITQNKLFYYDSDYYHSTKNNSNRISLNNMNLKFENTFTINILNSYCMNDEINETYSVKMTNNLSYNNHIIETHRDSPSIKDTVTCKDLIQIEKDPPIFTSTSQYRTEIEPLNFCEVIINSTEMRGVEHEFDTIFCDNEKSIDTNNQMLVNTLEREISKSTDMYEKHEGVNKQPSMEIINSEAYNADDFKLKSRHRFVPKGMSQIFNIKLKKNTDYNDDEEYYENAIYKHFAEDVRDKFEIFEPCVNNVKDIVSKDLNKANDKINRDNADLIFNSESLKQAQIFGQIDKKFIAARIQSRCSSDGKQSDYLTLFDQHAVNERVRLENNLSDYFDGIKWKSVAIETIKIKFSHDDYLYLYNYKDKFTTFGLQWTFEDNHVSIHAVPEAILGKNPRKVEIVFTAVKKLISEQIEIIKSTRGNVSLYPKCIMELIFSEACRYAVKFGDQLSKDDCVRMIGALANCKTPFQCAHGRPVMAIIMEIPNNNRTYEANLSSLQKFNKIIT